MKKLCNILAIILCLSCFVSCSTPSTEEQAEVLEEFKVLYQKSLAINDYIFGKGLPYEGEVGEEAISPCYLDVKADAPYRTQEALADAVKEVYSADYYADALSLTLFEGFGEKTSLKARYRIQNGVLQVDALYEGFDTSGRFDLSTAKITKLSSGSCTVKAKYVRGEMEGEYTLTMIKTETGWRFDSPTY